MKQKDIIYGIRPLIEALKAGKEIDKLLFQTGLKGPMFYELKELVNQMEIPFQYVPMEKLNKLTYQNHQGVVGYISSVTYQKVEDIIQNVFDKGDVPLILILDRITDVRNFGAIARTAECAGVHAIVIPSKGAARINEDSVKTSAGALHKIPVCRDENLKVTIDYLKNSGLQIVSCTEKTDRLVYDADYSIPTAIILGSEEDGISQEYLKKSDKLVKIPIVGEIESLNVSVACGIILFEAVKQRL